MLEKHQVYNKVYYRVQEALDGKVAINLTCWNEFFMEYLMNFPYLEFFDIRKHPYKPSFYVIIYDELHKEVQDTLKKSLVEYIKEKYILEILGPESPSLATY